MQVQLSAQEEFRGMKVNKGSAERGFFHADAAKRNERNNEMVEEQREWRRQ